MPSPLTKDKLDFSVSFGNSTTVCSEADVRSAVEHLKEKSCRYYGYDEVCPQKTDQQHKKLKKPIVCEECKLIDASFPAFKEAKK